MKKRCAAVLLALVLCLTPAGATEGPYARTADQILAAGAWSQSGEVVAWALSQMGYTEDPNEYTVFGECYGFSHGFWCDMFVSWCADRAGVPERAFPRSVNCQQHVRMFSAIGRYQPSAARGGEYTPLQGDLALFQYPETGRVHHVGLVLYVEDGKVFVVEGNALTKRWDYPEDVVAEARDDDLEPCDYVTCNMYSLTSPMLHGYAVPIYSSRDALALEGFADLGRYSASEEAINAVVSAGLMEGTSSHTFSPRGGMSRGEFLQAALKLCGLAGWTESPGWQAGNPGWWTESPGWTGNPGWWTESLGWAGNPGWWTGTPAFDDVPMDNPYYSAVMAARSAGLLPESGENRFDPDIWIDREDAQYILSGLCRQLGLGERSFTFTDGDLSNILTPYTTRGDIAVAFYELINSPYRSASA